MPLKIIHALTTPSTAEELRPLATQKVYKKLTPAEKADLGYAQLLAHKYPQHSTFESERPIREFEGRVNDKADKLATRSQVASDVFNNGTALTLGMLLPWEKLSSPITLGGLSKTALDTSFLASGFQGVKKLSSLGLKQSIEENGLGKALAEKLPEAAEGAMNVAFAAAPALGIAKIVKPIK